MKDQILFQQAALQLLATWQEIRQIDALDAAHRPASRAQGYATQAALFAATQDVTYGWKIAATSVAGQKHIGVSGPLAGRLLASRRLVSGDPVSLSGNVMRVMEAEFAFHLGRDVLPASQALSQHDVMSCVDALHLAIEIPNSRYTDFEHVGEASLIADFACAGHVVMGAAVQTPWQDKDLSQHVVHVHRAGTLVAQGTGANVLGDPRLALTWLANELISHGMHLKKGDTVITGTCVVPVPVTEGDQMVADFGDLGQVAVQFQN